MKTFFSILVTLLLLFIASLSMIEVNCYDDNYNDSILFFRFIGILISISVLLNLFYISKVKYYFLKFVLNITFILILIFTFLGYMESYKAC